MQIDILGPLVVRNDAGGTVDIAGARLRTLLARLALDAGRAVSVPALVEVVWGDTPPADENNALQTLVSRLRRTLGPAAVVQSPGGYRLDAEVDASQFRTLVRGAAEALRRGDAAAVELYGAPLALWRGPALADVRQAADELGQRADQLDAARVVAQLDRAEALLALDGESPDLDELAAIVRDHPLDERAAQVHLRTLAAAGRTNDALHAYDSLRHRLADELGVDPAPALQELHLNLLRSDDAPALTPRRTNLKAQLTSFVGREDELSRVAKTLEGNRLVTVVGPGGAGKTRLATEVGHRVLDTAPDGVWLTELASVTSGADVAQAVYGALGLREIHLFGDRRAQTTTRDAMTKLRDALTDRSAVLVLDNCEHVIEAAAELAETLLSECADLRILATSREPLGIFGESLIAIRPLGQPETDAVPADALTYPAVRLFADRAVAAAPDFTVDDANVAAVVEIVRRLDGLPLAIELAAARLRTLPVDEIAHRLGDRFRLLTGGSRTALPRHRTLRAVVEWSWELLTDDERRFAESLSVFPAGVTARSAAAVHPDVPPEWVADDVLASLADKSLLQPVDGGRRMRMLETIREYGADRLVERGQLADARERHARYFRGVLHEAEPYLITREQLPWFELLTAERENITAALRYYCDAGDADTALSMALSLGGYAMMLGAHSDVASWTGDAIAVAGGDPQLRLLARAMLLLNATASGVRDTDASGMAQLRDIVGELRIAEVTPQNPMVALMLPAVAFFAADTALAEEWLDRATRAENRWVRAASFMFRATFAENSGQLDRSRVDLAVALAEFEEIGERWGLASTLRDTAQLRTSDGDLAGARDAYERALKLTLELQSVDDQDFVWARLADVALRQGDVEAARNYIEQPMLAANEDTHSPFDLVFRLAMVGEMEYRLGQHEAGRSKVCEAIERLELLPRVQPSMGHMRAISYAASARIAARDGDLDRAHEHAEEARLAAYGTEDRPMLAMAGVLLAILTQADDPRRAAYLLGATAVLRGSEDPTDLDITVLRDALMLELGDEFAVAYGEGRSLPSEAAIALFERDGDQERLR